MTVHDYFASVSATKKGQHLMAMGAMVLTAFFWAVVEILGGLIPRGYSPVQTVWSRYLVHLLFMIAVFGPRQGKTLLRTGCIGLQVSRALLMLGMPLCFIWGAAILPVRVVWLLSWGSVMMMLALGWLLLREPVAPGAWIAAGAGWVGIWVMSGSDLPPVSWRYLAPLGMGFCFALYVTMTKRMPTENTYAKLFHTALWVFLPLSLVLPLRWKMPSPQVLGIYCSIGLLGYLALFFLDKSIELAPTSLTAPLIYTMPLWLAFLNYLVAGKLLGGMAVAGALIVLATSTGLVLNEWAGRLSLVNRNSQQGDLFHEG
jgi:drug/metabolite transporter (DMT)-like permease